MIHVNMRNWNTRLGGVALACIMSLGLVLAPGQAAAQGEPVLTGAVEADFPASITFSLEAAGTAVVSDVRLQYRVEHDSFARVVSEVKPLFTPSTRVSASWTWDMRQSGGLPPGTKVEYWWVVKDAAGKSAASSREVFVFSDARFKWRQISGGNIILNWYQGSESTARLALDNALQGLAGLEARTGASLVKPVNVYLYADTDDMLGGMIFPQEWTGAATYTDFSTIILGLSDDSDWNEKTMVHELAHLVSYQLSYGPYSSLPEWLSEGFSMYAEGELDIFSESELVTALNDDTTITVRSLSCPFSARSELSYLAYAESYSLVDYLVKTYGQQKMLSLLKIFNRGAGFDEALLNTYGFDMDGFYREWLKYALRQYVGVVA
jgi:hypothetical protein